MCFFVYGSYVLTMFYRYMIDDTCAPPSPWVLYPHDMQLDVNCADRVFVIFRIDKRHIRICFMF